MTCHRIPNGFVCTAAHGRLHIGTRYYWVEYAPYLGPSFYFDARMTRPIEPSEESPLWDAFKVWLYKRSTKKGGGI